MMNSTVKDTAEKAKDYAAEKLHDARDKSGEAYAAARETASDAYEKARAKASAAGKATAQGIDEYPVAALIGGLALGAIAGVLLPRTDAETRALGPVTSKLADTAKAAGVAAREAGRDKLDELGITPDAAREQAAKLAETALAAAKSAGTAAAGTVRS